MKPSEALVEGRKRVPDYHRGALLRIDREGRITAACAMGAMAVGRGAVAMVPDRDGELLVHLGVRQWWLARAWWWRGSVQPVALPCQCYDHRQALDVAVAHLSDHHPEFDLVPWLQSIGQ